MINYIFMLIMLKYTLLILIKTTQWVFHRKNKKVQFKYSDDALN